MNENLDRKILGENIKKRRIELGLTQKKVTIQKQKSYQKK